MKKTFIGISILCSCVIAQDTNATNQINSGFNSGIKPPINTSLQTDSMPVGSHNVANNPLQNIEKNNNIALPNNAQNEFADSLANQINSRLGVIHKQIEEANSIKNSSLNTPLSQMLDEKRVEQFLPVMTGGYEITKKDSKKALEKKALTMDEKGQRYYLNLNNNDVLKGLNSDYLVYKNSNTDKTFKSPMALPDYGKDFKISSTNTINSVTPLAQNQLSSLPKNSTLSIPTNTPSADKVIRELNSIK